MALVGSASGKMCCKTSGSTASRPNQENMNISYGTSDMCHNIGYTGYTAILQGPIVVITVYNLIYISHYFTLRSEGFCFSRKQTGSTNQPAQSGYVHHPAMQSNAPPVQSQLGQATYDACVSSGPTWESVRPIHEIL